MHFPLALVRRFFCLPSNVTNDHGEKLLVRQRRLTAALHVLPLKLAAEALDEHTEANKVLKLDRRLLRVMRMLVVRGVHGRLRLKASHGQLRETGRQIEAELAQRTAQLLAVDGAAAILIEAMEERAPLLQIEEERAELFRLDRCGLVAIEEIDHLGARVEAELIKALLLQSLLQVVDGEAVCAEIVLRRKIPGGCGIIRTN